MKGGGSCVSRRTKSEKLVYYPIEVVFPYQYTRSVRTHTIVYYTPTFASCVFSPSLVLGHVLSPVRSLPRHSLLLIANYTSEPVCQLHGFQQFLENPLPLCRYLELGRVVAWVRGRVAGGMLFVHQ